MTFQLHRKLGGTQGRLACAENINCRPVQYMARCCAHYDILAQHGNNALKYDGMGGVVIETLVTIGEEHACT
jgi:hypothetical protein